jgi:FdhD protein
MMSLKSHRRNLTGRTGCGLCGSESLETAIRPIKSVTPQALPSSPVIQHALSQLSEQQTLQALTGAVHGAAWCDDTGEMLLLCEDVGRHNALDKLIGSLALRKINTQSGFVVISSRASYEMVQKVTSVNIATLIAVSAPTVLAISLANQAKLNLIGFARPGRHTFYTKLDK